MDSGVWWIGNSSRGTGTGTGVLRLAPVVAGQHSRQRLAIVDQLVDVVGHRLFAEMDRSVTGPQKHNGPLDGGVRHVKLDVSKRVPGELLIERGDLVQPQEMRHPRESVFGRD